MPKFEDEPDAAAGRSSTSNRRETILSLVEMLLKQGDDHDMLGLNQQPTFEDDRDVPTVDEHHQTAGAEAFNRFQKRINNLDKELRNFSNAARQLGSSAAILSSAFHLRTRIAHIGYLYHTNAADLYPRKIKPPASTHALPDVDDMGRIPRYRPKPRRKYRLSGKHRALPHVARPTVDTTVDLEDFPNQFEQLAEEVTTFVNCLNEFPEFTDEAVNASISSFEGDLKYWASCLHNYSGQFRYPAVQRYIQDLAVEMGEHIDSITSTLAMFIEVGVPTIRFAQKHGATNLLNLSTVATFFSAVTATTIQFSYQLNSPSGTAVNVFWFLSLVFSIAAAVNSLLGLTWKQAMYRSPGHRVPWWVLIWIKRSPLIFLVLSVASFSIGLCLFTYASDQHRIVATITTVFTGFTSFGLAAVSAWFASERWAFTHHRGTKWLGDVLVEVNESFLRLPGISFVRRGLRQSSKWASRVTSGARTKLRRVKSITKSIISSDGEKASDIENGLPMTMGPEDATMAPSAMGRRRPSETGPASPLDSPAISTTIGSLTPMGPGSPPNTPSSPTSPSVGKQLWKNALRTVKMSSILSHPTRSPHRQRTTSSTLLSSDRKRMISEPPVKAIVRSRVAALVPKLKCLEPTQDMACHQALVRHLQFSPDGKFLATSSWDRTSVILRVENSVVAHHRTLAHAKGFVGQVAWSPTGHLLLTKLNRGVKVWTQDGVCQRTIDRPAYVESITWFPGGEAFLSVEGSDVAKLDLKGKVLGTYNFGSIKLQDVAVTPDGTRLLGVGPLLQSPDGLLPSKSRAEKRLAIYNMDTKQIEHATPVLNDVKDITLARNTRNGLVALVSYENKAPPQLWKLETVRDAARLTLRHTYMPKSPVDFAGPSYFGGKNDELVLCAGKGKSLLVASGDIHIWDQESGALLHHVRAQDLGGDLTCIAWNHAEDNPFMFATGSHDGALRIWTKLAERRPSTSVLETSLPFTRSASPSDMEDMTRTESPLTQQEFESSFANSMESLGTGPSSSSANRERTVAFAAEHTVGPTVDSDASP
ncbi:WD40 repeat-like protein [Gymnopus androsaceus JB14]|uniref:WD40 repeat-like protein n=1 Tax=Gymnopus androsaceus JB14 TaxID=1447944 RepID=A0A6A4H361_9AGAR|nr:WD40 repeat-like protein [Gymnopus androsaceus JB14]